MVEPVIACPHCHKEIKLTESLAAPLVEATRREYEAKLAEKDSEVTRRESALRDQERELTDAKERIDEQIQEGVRRERQTIAAEEAKKARLLVWDELAGKSQEVSELEEILKLKDNKLLTAKFPIDIIEPVPKGEFGGDLIQRVLGSSGQQCGTILWESKRTRNWSDAWISKLRNDQRAARADFGVFVTRTLPKGVDSFELIDGIWVVQYRFAIPIATALRQSLIEIAGVRQANEGQYTKMGMVYQYLTGPRFRDHVQSIVEKFTEMEEDLSRERKTMTRLWAKREEQIRRVISSTAGMYGDLQGIAGKGLNEIEGLEIAMLPAEVTQD